MREQGPEGPRIRKTSAVWYGDPCADHALHHATAPTPGANGRVVYVICLCGRRRAVWPEVWDEELDRRRKEAGSGA